MNATNANVVQVIRYILDALAREGAIEDSDMHEIFKWLDINATNLGPSPRPRWSPKIAVFVEAPKSPTPEQAEDALAIVGDDELSDWMAGERTEADCLAMESRISALRAILAWYRDGRPGMKKV